MPDFINELLTTETGLLGVLVALAWRLLGNEKQKATEARVRDAARAAFYAAKAATGMTSERLFASAKLRAFELLSTLGIKADDKIGKLVTFELEQLVIEDNIMRAHLTASKLSTNPEKTFAEAEARGRARGEALGPQNELAPETPTP